MIMSTTQTQKEKIFSDVTKLELELPVTKTVQITKHKSYYEWNGVYSSQSCIFAKYFGCDIVDFTNRLDNLVQRYVITPDQRDKFKQSICNMDIAFGKSEDVQNIQELASILGMEVQVL